jgi:hypothetical protein
VAAGVSQAAERTVSSCAEPGQEGETRKVSALWARVVRMRIIHMLVIPMEVKLLLVRLESEFDGCSLRSSSH